MLDILIAIAIWLALGLPAAIVLLATFWFSFDEITLGDVALAAFVVLVGPPTLILAVLILIMSFVYWVAQKWPWASMSTVILRRASR